MKQLYSVPNGTAIIVDNFSTYIKSLRDYQAVISHANQKENLHIFNSSNSQIDFVKPYSLNINPLKCYFCQK